MSLVEFIVAVVLVVVALANLYVAKRNLDGWFALHRETIALGEEAARLAAAAAEFARQRARVVAATQSHGDTPP